MRVEIFIVSFRRDVEFLRFCLRSIRKYAIGFHAVRVVVPNVDFELFRWVENFGAILHGYDEHPEKGFVHHQFQIICADEWCPDAKAIVHLDSDCMFWKPTTPEDYFVDGRPILFREPYATLTNKLRLHWRDAVKAATGIDPVYETMVRHPAVHLPEVYQKTRELIVTHTGRSVEDYILSCKNDFPQNVAEFPTLGAVAIEHFAEKYQFVECDVRTPDGGYDYRKVRDHLIAHWSHGGAEKYRVVSEEILS